MYVKAPLSFLVVVGVEVVHSTQQLVRVNQWEESNKSTKDVPEPEVGSTERVRNPTALKFVSDAIADAVTPHNWGNAARKPAPE